jgi:cation diffusion facilitator family transporter
MYFSLRPVWAEEKSRMSHDHSASRRHSHVFDREKVAIEKRTLLVVLITFVTMIAEIVVGWLSNSMALFADGWHMGTHAFALGLSWVAYRLARKHASDRRFAFGTWKIEILGAFSSAIVLGVVGVLMVWTSLERLLHPKEIRYGQALIVAAIGLIVNIGSAVILDFRESRSDHDHEHERKNAGSGGVSWSSSDLNLKSAYLHVAADALTSVLAVAALLGAKYSRWNGLDPVMGIVGAALILRWAFSLVKETSGILLDRAPDAEDPLPKTITRTIESDGDANIRDLHLWKVAPNRYACILSLDAQDPRPVDEYKQRLTGYPELAHVTIEIERCGVSDLV